MNTIRYSIRRVARLEIQITATFPSTTLDGRKIEVIHLPTWRPGRYELGNFSQYVFGMCEQSGAEWEPMQKEDLHSWKLASETKKQTEHPRTVRYNFRCHAMDAGSTWADDDVLYVNPVNCMVYHPDLADFPCEVLLEDVPSEWKLACQLPQDADHTLRASDMQELMDSPFIAAPQLTTQSFKASGVEFHVHSWGEIHFDYSAFVAAHEAFASCQLAAFQGFPVDAYHFIYLFPPFPARHGVEHEASTVISMGPAERMAEPAFYEETLAIGSHELVHTWNVKSLRPAEWMPYDFSKSSPSRLGYVAEGVTTYLGDLFLYEAGLIDLDGWLKRFGAYVKKHLWNPGRLTTSLADSGFDTWLDGYARAGGGLPAVPHRVGNIYVEGAMLAFLCDVALNQANGTLLVDAMREMWIDAQAAPRAGRPKGLTEEAYWNKLASCGGNGSSNNEKLAELRANFCDGTPRDSWPSLVQAFAHQGITATLARNPNALHAAGALTRNRGDQPAEVVSVWPESPAWNAGLVPGARIHSVESSPSAGLVQVQFSHAGRSFDKALEAEKSLISSEKLSGFSAGYFPQIELGKS